MYAFFFITKKLLGLGIFFINIFFLMKISIERKTSTPVRKSQKPGYHVSFLNKTGDKSAFL